jgi:hypothetical protein
VNKVNESEHNNKEERREEKRSHRNHLHTPYVTHISYRTTSILRVRVRAFIHSSSKLFLSTALSATHLPLYIISCLLCFDYDCRAISGEVKVALGKAKLGKATSIDLPSLVACGIQGVW